MTATPAVALNDVQATLTGPVTVALRCQPDGTTTVCTWPSETPVMEGTYALQITAAGGYQAINTQVQVTIAAPTCGCTPASINPSAQALLSADAATGVEIPPVDGGRD